MEITSVTWIDEAAGAVLVNINDKGTSTMISGVPPFAAPYGELYDAWLGDNTPSDPVVPPLTPMDCPLSPDQFYTMLENEGKLDAFVDAIETVTPVSKKLTCRNQFNNASVFTWDMVLVSQVMPKAEIYGATWEETLWPIWVDAFQSLSIAA